MESQSKKVFSVVLIALLIPCVVRASAIAYQEDALFLRHTEHGLFFVQQPGLPHTEETMMPENAAVVWSHYLTDATYNTTSNTVDGYVFAGTWLNAPQEAELFALSGGGTPEWGYSGTNFFTDAGDNAFTLAAVDVDASGVNVIKWTGPGDGTPDWDTSFAGYGITSYGPIAVSDDGSTIAVIAAPSGTDAHLLLFDADSPAPLTDYVASGLGFPRYVRINADGRYTAFIALATIVVFDRDLLSVRDWISMGFSNSAMDISGDGNLLAYGWPSLVLMEWNGASYQSIWSWSPGGYYVSNIAISNDGSTIISCWYTLSFNTLKVVVHNVGSSTPLWTYDYAPSSGTYQEEASDIEITDDGKYFIVGSLGDDANLNPEVHIFQRDDTPHVYYTVDMPGSMVSVDILNDGTYATACGKHIHLNAMGRGGDIVLIQTEIPGIVSDDRANVLDDFSSLDICPNPFKTTTHIQYSVGRGYQKPELRIYDASGRLVKDFRLMHDAANPAVLSWDGRDDQGRQLPGGVYVVQLESPQHKETRKAIFLK